MSIKQAVERFTLLLALFGAVEFTVILRDAHAQVDHNESVLDVKQEDHLEYDDKRLGIIETQIQGMDALQRLQDKRMEHDESLVIGVFCAIGALQSVGVFKGALERLFSHTVTSTMSVVPKE